MSQRIDYLDIAKLIGLSLVCFCHIPLPEGDFHVWVYSFHMPLFFLLSGMFFKPESFSVKRTAMQLLVPFILFNVLAVFMSVCVDFLLYRTLQFPNLHPMKWLMSGYAIGPSWFLLSLFCIRVFCSYAYKYGKIRTLLIVTIVLLGTFVFTENCSVWNMLNLGSSVLGLPFYLMGYITKEYVLKYINYGGIGTTVLMAIVSLLAILNGQVGIHEHSYGNNMIAFLFFGLMGTAVLVRLSQYIRIPHKILDTFMQGALFYLCMHTLMFEYMLLIWNKATGDFSGNTLLEKIIVTILTFVVSYPIIRFMLKFTPIFLGKQLKK
ncbi:acyltransferase family protein [Bacteroides acidifaciens]|uniref:acyltransferase family protein n=3 Tax=Bacteroides TaxID=816 RepID=UPI000468E074|nr:acyltransferase family protein [Bacteroides acidifaciens]MCR1996566.1 acyltransferase family protein [Bacteroides acidifaciens]